MGRQHFKGFCPSPAFSTAGYPILKKLILKVTTSTVGPLCHGMDPTVEPTSLGRHKDVRPVFFFFLMVVSDRLQTHACLSIICNHTWHSIPNSQPSNRILVNFPHLYRDKYPSNEVYSSRKNINKNSFRSTNQMAWAFGPTLSMAPHIRGSTVEISEENFFINSQHWELLLAMAAEILKKLLILCLFGGWKLIQLI